MPEQLPCGYYNQREDYYDFIVEGTFNSDERVTQELYGILPDFCLEQFGTKYQFLHLPQREKINYYITRLGYTALPKVFGLMDTTSIGATGALRLQNQPILSLRGQGTLIGIVDTGERVIIMSVTQTST